MKKILLLSCTLIALVTSFIFQTASAQTTINFNDLSNNIGLGRAYSLEGFTFEVNLAESSGREIVSDNEGNGFEGSAFLYDNNVTAEAPAPNFIGSVNLDLFVSDNGFSGSGGALSDSKIITIDVIIPPAFTEISTVIEGLIQSSIAWGDYDGDGDLDILVTGQSSTSIGVSKV
ncbi:MAG: hypothetical protein ACQEW9_07985, partial [Bacteroidota bacterium]